MPFRIHKALTGESAYENLKAEGDPILDEWGLQPYTIEIRPATRLEEKAVAGEGLAPVEDSGDNFVPDTQRMVIYRTESAQNPLLQNAESDPATCARTIVERLSQHLKGLEASVE